MARDSPRTAVLQLCENEDVCYFWSSSHEPRNYDEPSERVVLQRLFRYLLWFHPAGRLRYFMLSYFFFFLT